MYAVIETGGKQYRVELGSELHVECRHPAGPPVEASERHREEAER